VVTFREASVADDAAVDLLTEYFDYRAASFPETMGDYQPTFPIESHFEPPAGVFLIVEGEDLAGEPSDVGCGGVRRIQRPESGLVRFEVKHLWVQPHLRGHGVGRLLLAELERRAIELGAEELVLDTNASLEAAGGLYRSSGFAEIEPYNNNPNATHWFGKRVG
jgi:GNAT superfamily N-acetyltransferase